MLKYQVIAQLFHDGFDSKNSQRAWHFRDTLQRWEKEGKNTHERKPKGRRYDFVQIVQMCQAEKDKGRKTFCYARVPSYEQKIITVFSAKLYARHNHKNKAVVQKCREVVNDLGAPHSN